jgi:hypothetical protein
MTEDNNKPVVKRSYTKKEKFEKEQLEIVERLNSILGLNEKNNKFILEELKSDEEKQKQIIGLEEDVKKYFAYNRWAYFKVGIQNEAISLMRSIYKNTGYDVNYKQKQKNGEKYTEYSISRKNL